MTATHKMSAEFMSDLREGVLHPFLQAIRSDETLMLGLRGRYVSIYYRGGQLLKLSKRGSDGDAYIVDFDSNYDSGGKLAERLQRSGGDIGLLKRPIVSIDDSRAIVDVFGELKCLMDIHPKIRSGHEREFQQLVARENNRTRSAGASDYFITDIEHANGDARFDMLGARWGHAERKRGDCLLPVLFEMKYGGDALDGRAGVLEHLEDILSRLKDPSFHEALRANVEAHFNQLHELDLLTFNRSVAIEKFAAVKDRVQVVFVLSGYNPRSTRLGKILDEVDKHMRQAAGGATVDGVALDLRFFHACFCGYAMHDETMLTLGQLRLLVDSWSSAKRAPVD